MSDYQYDQLLTELCEPEVLNSCLIIHLEMIPAIVVISYIFHMVFKVDSLHAG